MIEMADIDSTIYTFAGFRLDTVERLLIEGDKVVTLPPRVFDTLQMLVANPGHVLSKEKMMSSIWDDSFVEENNLAQNISQLRRLLGETSDQKFIETVPKYGYRFVAPVKFDRPPGIATEVVEQSRARIYIDDGSPENISPPSLTGSNALAAIIDKLNPETHYVQNGDVNIAYQVVGNGPVDIVFVMGWISHLEYFWKHYTFASFLERLASFSRLILFDKRGTGLSDRVAISDLPTLEQRMEDVGSVMDAAGSERAVLFGVSEGGPMCALFAATYPERTTAVMMFGTYARRIKDVDYPWAPDSDDRSEFFELIRREWGTAVGIEERAPSLANDPEFRSWWAEYLRMGASPGAAVALTKMNVEVDVRAILPLVRVPTLVMHRTGDKCLNVEEGRYVASKIPDCKFVAFDGDDHLPFVGNHQLVIDEIERFVAGVRFAGEYNRVLATVMSLKIIDRDGEVQKRGAKEWEELLSQSRVFVRRQFDLFKGREISVGHGQVLTAFDGPARAIRCAAAIVESAHRSGIAVRTGIHTGECEFTDGIYSGIAVELAQDISDECSVGQILVSRTVKDLVAGSGLEFKEFGLRSFESMDGDLRLFTVIR